MFKTGVKTAMGAALLIGAMSAQALVIKRIDTEVRAFNYANFVKPTTLAQASTVFDSATFTCANVYQLFQ